MDDERRCTAHLTDGTGTRCRRAAISGGTVCATHGGSAPQVKRSARERLLEAADPAAARLVRALESEDERSAIRAAQIILDRAGLHPTQAVELSGPSGGPVEIEPIPWRQVSLDLRRALLAQIEAVKQGSPIPEYRVVAVSTSVPEPDSTAGRYVDGEDS
jgi:hypothetical protein